MAQVSCSNSGIMQVCSACILPAHLAATAECAAMLAGKLSKAESERIMHDNGLNKLVFAFHPEFIPLVDPTNIAPQDILHLFPDGLLRHEGAWLVYILLKLGLKISEINLAIRKYRVWPSDVRIPDLHEGLSKGAKGGRPKSSAMLRMTGSQCMHFALHR
jgi:hypothetical protein